MGVCCERGLIEDVLSVNIEKICCERVLSGGML